MFNTTPILGRVWYSQGTIQFLFRIRTSKVSVLCRSHIRMKDGSQNYKGNSAKLPRHSTPEGNQKAEKISMTFIRFILYVLLDCKGMYSGVCYLVMCAIMCIVYKSVMYTEKICIYVYIYIYIYIYVCVCI